MIPANPGSTTQYFAKNFPKSLKGLRACQYCIASEVMHIDF